MGDCNGYGAESSAGVCTGETPDEVERKLRCEIFEREKDK